MNNTNRALNRSLVLVAGLLLLTAATLLSALATQSAVQRAWNASSDSSRRTASSWLQATPLAGSGHSWLWIVVLVFLTAVVVVMLVFILRQGGGHSRQLINEQTTDWGTTQVDSAVAEQSLRQSLSEYPELISTRVSTYRVARDCVLKVSVICRRGSSPTQVAHVIEENLYALDQSLGLHIPALVQISGGFRTRTSRTTRTH